MCLHRSTANFQIQLMTGTPAWTMWFTCFTWDLLTYIISALLVFIFLVAIDPQGNFTLNGAPGKYMFLAEIFCCICFWQKSLATQVFCYLDRVG